MLSLVLPEGAKRPSCKIQADTRSGGAPGKAASGVDGITPVLTTRGSSGSGPRPVREGRAGPEREQSGSPCEAAPRAGGSGIEDATVVRSQRNRVETITDGNREPEDTQRERRGDWDAGHGLVPRRLSNLEETGQVTGILAEVPTILSIVNDVAGRVGP